MDRAEGRVDVEVEHPVPGIGVAVLHRAADIGPGIGVEDVELAGERKDAGQDSRRLCPVEEIDLQVEILATNSPLNLVYPFYLREASAPGGL